MKPFRILRLTVSSEVLASQHDTSGLRNSASLMKQLNILDNARLRRLEDLIWPLIFSGLGLLLGASLGPLLAASRLVPIVVALPLLGLLGMAAGYFVGLRIGKRLPSISTSGYGKKVLALILFSAAIPFLVSSARKPTLSASLGATVFVLTGLFVVLPGRSVSFEIVLTIAVTLASALMYLESGGLQWLVMAIVWAAAGCAVIIRQTRSAAR
jgi:hypothetical protein